LKEIGNIKNRFIQNDETILKVINLFKGNYVKDDVEILSHEFQKEIIDSTAIKFLEQSLDKILKEIPQSLSKKVKSFLAKKGIIKETINKNNDDNNNLELSKKSIIFSYSSLKELIPGFTVFFNIVKSFSLLSVVWRRENSFDGIMKTFFTYFNSKYNEFLKKFKKFYNETFENLVCFIRNSKEDLSMNQELKIILEKYEKLEVDENLIRINDDYDNFKSPF